MAKQLLIVSEAAAFLRSAPSTLNTWRSQGNGPPYAKLGGRVVYDLDDLEAWAESQKRRSTAERASRAA